MSVDPSPVTPPTGPTDEVRTRRLVVVDEAGEEHIVAEVNGGHAEVQLFLAGSVPGHDSMVVLSAGSDPQLGPTVGVHLWAEGDQLAGFSGWRDGADPWRADLDGPALDLPGRAG